jgi:hypothetical protein
MYKVLQVLKSKTFILNHKFEYNNIIIFFEYAHI